MDEAVRLEEGPQPAGPDAVHRAGLQVHQDGAGHVLLTCTENEGVSRLLFFYKLMFHQNRTLWRGAHQKRRGKMVSLVGRLKVHPDPANL